MGADESGAVWIPTPNMWANRYGHTPTYIILHGTASPNAFYAQDVAHYFQRVSADSSSHYVVGRDGVVVQCVAERDAAWGNGIIEPSATKAADPWWSKDLNPNLITISIEHVQPDSENATGLTDVQSQASFQLITHICKRWNIPLRPADAKGGITGHYSIDPLNRLHCPGNYPWNDLWKYLKEKGMIDLSNPMISRYFVLWQGNWKCKQKTSDGVTTPDNHIIRGDILTFYQSIGETGVNGLTLLGLPVEDDHEVLDSSGKAISGVLEQRFERGVVRLDPNHVIDNPPGSGTCYLAHVDALYSSQKQIQTLTEEIAQQKTQIQSLQAQEQKQQIPTQTIDIPSLVEHIVEEIGQRFGSAAINTTDTQTKAT